MIDTQLKGKTVLITGGNHGIGAATAKAFAAEGAKVFITYLRLSPENYGVSQAEAQSATAPGLPFYYARRTQTAEDVINAIRAEGGQAEAFEANLAEPESIPQVFDRAEAAFGPISILVNNAAHWEPDDTIFTTSAAGIDASLAVNMRAAILLIQEFLRRIKAWGQSWGRVINLSTDSAQVFAGQITYGASKAAVEAFTRSIAIEAGPMGVTINTVAPGPVQTGYLSSAAEERLLPSIPLRRLGQPEDIADVIVFLASEQARWLTGQVIKVSGGHAL